MRGCPCGNLGNHGACSNGILVAHKVTNHVAVALFSATDECFLAFKFEDFGSNPLESCQYVVHLHANLLGDIGRKLAGDDGLDDELFAGQLAFLFPFFEQIVDEDTHCLVTVEEHPFAIGFLDGNTDAVGIRVAGENDVGINLLCQIDGHFHCCMLFGVGRWGSGEVPVGGCLPFNDVDVGEP